MKLEVDKNHKKIRSDKTKKPFYRFNVGVAAGMMIVVSLFSGASLDAAAKVNDASSIVWNIDDHEMEFPEAISKELEFALMKTPGSSVTRDEISYVHSLSIDVDDSVTSLSSLEVLYNLKNLTIYLKTDDCSVLKTLSNVSSIEDLDIYAYDYQTIDADTLKAINNFGNLKKLTINYSIDFAPGCEEELNKLSSLKMNNSSWDIDFSKLTNLKELDLSSSDPYDLAVYLNSNEYQRLVDSGVNIVFENNTEKEQYLEASQKLDKIVESLDINENSSDNDILDAVMIYVLENLTYDDDVSKTYSSSGYTSGLYDKFYEGGLLYGALEMDTSICGNYSALTEALMDRLTIPSTTHLALSDNHAWNIVKINGEPYYVDVTWIDQLFNQSENHVSILADDENAEDVIKNGEGHILRWYREDPDEDNISRIDNNDSHIPNYIPDYMLTEESKDSISFREKEAIEEAPEVGDKQVKVSIGGKEIVIGLGALLGVLGAVSGTVVAVKKRNRKEKKDIIQYDEVDTSINNEIHIK